MSHFSVIVATDDRDGDSIDKALVPLREGETFFETEDGEAEARWDWYALGGRFAGRLIGRPGSERHAGKPPSWGPAIEYAPLACDQVRKRDLDWEAMGIEAAKSAVAAYHQMLEAVEGGESAEFARAHLRLLARRVRRGRRSSGDRALGAGGARRCHERAPRLG